MEPNTAPVHTALHLIDVPASTLTRAPKCTTIDGKGNARERTLVRSALYVAPLYPGEGGIDAASKFQVRSLIAYEDGDREDFIMGEFRDLELAVEGSHACMLARLEAMNRVKGC